MKNFIISALLACSQAVRITDDMPAVARSYNADNEPVLDTFRIQSNDELLIDLDVTRDVDALIQINAATIHWNEQKPGKPYTNHCSNDSKATGKLEPCNQEYNSAWNTYSSAVTAKPSEAQKGFYPGWHAVKHRELAGYA